MEIIFCILSILTYSFSGHRHYHGPRTNAHDGQAETLNSAARADKADDSKSQTASDV
jgi:hypothetical protein